MTTILIVEDEILIAESIERYLRAEGYAIAAIAISFDEAILVLTQQSVDLVLLDIRLDGRKTGIDLAEWIRLQRPGLPFVFLTSQVDKNTLECAKNTFPAGYLVKPIQKESLVATMTIVLHQVLQNRSPQKQDWITISDGSNHYRLNQKDILYLEADHVYVNIYLKGKDAPVIVRQSLRYFRELLDEQVFLQPNRSYLVNFQYINAWDNEQVWVEGNPIKISRRNKETILQILDQYLSRLTD